MRINAFVVIILLLVSLSMVYAQIQASAVFVNGKIWTGEKGSPEARSLAVYGERIVAVGEAKDMEPYKGPQTKVVDLKGRRVLPGFNDAHVHFVSGGFSLLGIDLRKARNAQEFRNILQEYAAKLPPGRWITGGDWDHEAWPEKKWPTKELIDDVTPQNPVLVSRLDGHISLANSLALKMAGIDKNTPDPFGGFIARDDKSSEPTGILKDNAANLVYRFIPSPSPAEVLEAARAAQEHALSVGVTSLQDMNPSTEELRIYQQMYREGEIKVRLYVFQPGHLIRELGDVGIQMAFGNAWLRVGGIKLYADGSMGAGSALFYQPYEDDPSTSGLAIQPKDELIRLVTQADSVGLQIALHAIGDKANTWALDAFEQAAQHNGRRDSRHRIEHAQVVLEKDLPRFAELGVIASVEPSHCIDDMRWAEQRIGARAKQSYLWKSFADHHASMAFGTDWSVEPLNPMLGLYAAITREFPEGDPQGGWYPKEKIGLEEAIRYYTAGSAFAEFMEHEKGTLAPGKLADFVVLDQDILHLPAKDILKTRVMMTVVGGKIMFQRE